MSNALRLSVICFYGNLNLYATNFVKLCAFKEILLHNLYLLSCILISISNNKEYSNSYRRLRMHNEELFLYLSNIKFWLMKPFKIFLKSELDNAKIMGEPI